ncbi:SRPBCC family protein [Paenibacillus daejeonensis]|uniref:SRPBCC family protein n=1 Tax=Paenibacillus daejeonensis TaxID=135193 RepID=UPI000371D104|nr:SRPBCC domain-containing protein [Paenibacillus daejeonensis]
MANIEHLHVVKASAEVVYEALTTGEGLSAIWTNELTVSQVIGDTLTFQFGADDLTQMRLIELVPHRRIVWECTASDPEWVGTTILIELEEKKSGKTWVTLAQQNWREVTPFFRLCNYNWAIFLHSLQLYVEQGTGMNYQSRV